MRGSIRHFHNPLQPEQQKLMGLLACWQQTMIMGRIVRPERLSQACAPRMVVPGRIYRVLWCPGWQVTPAAFIPPPPGPGVGEMPFGAVAISPEMHLLLPACQLGVNNHREKLYGAL